MFDIKKTGNTRWVKKYFFFGPLVLEEEVSWQQEYDIMFGHGRGIETVYYWRKVE